MSLLNYYNFEKREDSAVHLFERVDKALGPFDIYLRNAINALKRKEVSARWEKAFQARIRLKPMKSIWLVTPKSEIQIQSEEFGCYRIERDLDENSAPDETFEPDIDEPVEIGKGKNRQKLQVMKDCFFQKKGWWYLRFDQELTGHRISWSGYSLELEPAWSQLESNLRLTVNGEERDFVIQEETITLNGVINGWDELKIDGQNVNFEVFSAFDLDSLAEFQPTPEGENYQIIASKRPTPDGCLVEDITLKSLKNIDPSSLKNSSGITLEFETPVYEKSGIALTVESADIYHNEIFTNDWGLSFKAIREKSDEPWIRLIDDEEENDDAGPTRSKLDYFFDDDIAIQDGQGRKLKRVRTNFERKELLLKVDARGRQEPVYPKSSVLRVTVNLNQYRKQQEAIRFLKNQPMPEHHKLIRLLDDRTKTEWDSFSPDEEPIWKVLTDEGIDGCALQRAFVRKALATPDFAFLDGPPGSGKTTVILELIYQAVQQNKRVLLCGSTHAAVNNVLERIRDHKMLDTIFPLRIGDEHRAIGVEEFQIDRMVQENGGEENRRLLIDASNLVCGTTMGILRLFRAENHLTPETPPFDYMIIDESSKTTFQEFLVPAIYAKRWILAGDIKQLSPFTDRDMITANLADLPVSGKETLSPDLQKACLYLQKLYPYKNNLILSTTKQVQFHLIQEIEKRLVSEKKDRNLSENSFAFITNSKRKTGKGVTLFSAEAIENHALELYHFNIICIDVALFAKLSRFLPPDAVVLDNREWLESDHAFRNNRQDYRFSQQWFRQSDSREISKELNRFFDEKSWPEELMWRMERNYWLRFIQRPSKNSRRRDKRSGMEEQIQRLLPYSAPNGTIGRIFRVEEMAFPSILEALTHAGYGKRKHEEPNTLNQGFRNVEMNSRYSTLTYQHRMHPEISDFSRQRFYTNKTDGVPVRESLLDGREIAQKRNWNYSRYQMVKRRCWVNVEGQNDRQDKTNKKEINALKRELIAFLDWAKGHPKKEERWEVACLTFYKAQERGIREMLQRLTGKKQAQNRFDVANATIKLATVDFFQGQEADLVFLTMRNTNRDGFMDSPNRLNVAITRARYQFVILGKRDYYLNGSPSEELRQLAMETDIFSTAHH